MSRLPDFFVAGAPKCGTTAVAEYLGGHPRVFVADPKEPFYFATDLPGMRKMTTEAEYLELFAGAGSEILTGEASTLYLFSRTAVPALLRDCPDCRLVVMLRPPAELVHAFHGQLLWGFLEDEEDFVRAWDLQEERAAGRHLPVGCREPSLLQYRRIGRLGEQIGRLLEWVPRSRVHFLLLEDLAARPRHEYLRLLDFLGLSDDGRTAFPRRNRHRVHRLRGLARVKNRFVREWPGLDRRLRPALRRLGLDAPLRGLLGREVPRSDLASEFRLRLVEGFAEDVCRLSDLIGRDLDHWNE